MNRLYIVWDGDLGVQSSLSYQGIFILLTGPGVDGSNHDVYIRDQLSQDTSIWRISSWHKNMRLMQVGGKSDDTGWGVYEESRKGGAIIAAGHEHSYTRTHLLSNMQNQTIASISNTLTLTKDDPVTSEDEGRSFVLVSGLGGRSIRDQQLSGAWWASIYTSTQGANHGALFGTFNYNGTRLWLISISWTSTAPSRTISLCAARCKRTCPLASRRSQPVIRWKREKWLLSA